jgi:GntR family transcriptional regulator, rspAB operon transcriptional repressor
MLHSKRRSLAAPKQLELMFGTHLESIDRPESLARRAYVALRKAIRDRALEPETLYSELQLAAELNTSRTPVREALIELSREGIVDVVPQRGFRLRKITEEEEREVFDLRGAIESYVVRRLAAQASKGDLAELEAILVRQAAVGQDVARFLELDESFHLTMPSLMSLTRSREMLGTLRGITFLTGSTALSTPDRTSEVIIEHRQIVDAIAARDPDRAARAVMNHLDRTFQHSRSRDWAHPNGNRSAPLTAEV